MSEIKLLPCPFCGGQANVCHNIYDNRGIVDEKTRYAIRCTLGCFARTNEFRKEEDAIKAWNTRKPMDDIVEQLEEMDIGQTHCASCSYRVDCEDNFTRICVLDAKFEAIDIVRASGKE